MSEEKKENSCATTGSGCSSCCGKIKILIVGLILGALIFMTGYIIGKGACPFSGQKTCSMMQR
ncbi:MAG: hypothetical protein WCH62_05735 [Candidatus Omnitrophota bacterium]